MRKILMLAGDFTEDYEVMVPYQALEMVGFKVDVVCPDKNSVNTLKLRYMILKDIKHILKK
ncbi:putative intracellular protease/amidase [Clostridium saccharobutylicum]|nr:putative intracellular protease/amidase [Clostridium saccharobutylicum]